MKNGQRVPSLQPNDSDDVPVCFTYGHPVKNSQPLFLMQESATGRYVASTDPYLFCTRVPLESIGQEAMTKSRKLHLTYDGTTQWLGILGYVMPKSQAHPELHRYTTIADAPSLADLFQAGAGDAAATLLVPAAAQDK